MPESTSEALHPATRIGAVHLTVSDLERSLAFYQEDLGLRVREREAGRAALGAGGADLLVLVENPEAHPVAGVTGLYHFALLVPSRRELARALDRLVVARARLQGAADHGVSEALYLADPDGHGIEIYRDRTPDAWPRSGGELAMTIDPLDLEGLLTDLPAETDADADGAADDPGLHADTRVGHVHLHVADLAAAQRFYVGGLGFAVTQRYGPAALFVAAGGYHHHVGLNTWKGVGAPRPPPDALGLRHFEIRLADRDEADRVARRLAAGTPAEERDDGLFVRDPSGNGILLAVG